MTLSPADVAWFAAEMAVYVSVGWWGATRELSWPARVLLGVSAVAAMAVAWGVFAAPEAPCSLSGPANVVFRSVWFCLGALALLAATTRQ